jgi:hypothetical protein
LRLNRKSPQKKELLLDSSLHIKGYTSKGTASFIWQKDTYCCFKWLKMSSEVLDIRLRLNGQVKDRFLEIKTAKGLTNNTEVLRLIINEYFEKKLARGSKDE